MEDRYPYLRFVIGAAQLLAGAIAVIIVLSATMRACHIGGFAGFVSFVVSLIVAGVAWVATMVWVESAQVFLDIEENTRKLVGQSSSPGAGTSPPSASGPL